MAPTSFIDHLMFTVAHKVIINARNKSNTIEIVNLAKAIDAYSIVTTSKYLVKHLNRNIMAI